MRTIAILSAAAWLLVLSGCATSRSGIVLKTDRWSRTLRIGDDVYHVTRESELFGADGQPIELHQVPTISDPGIGVRRAARARADFRAREHAGRWYLEELQVRPR